MNYWIFKLANQDIYPEQPGETYVYDNTRSVRVRSEDVFIYLDKRRGGYSFSGTSRVRRIGKHHPTATELSRNPKIRTYVSNTTSLIITTMPERLT